MTITDTFMLGGNRPIHRIGFGAMRLATDGFSGPPRDPEVGRSVLRRAVELGVDHIDTASFYISDDNTVSANTLIRQALHPYPADLVVATKIGPQRTPDGGVRMSTDPGELRRMVETNLEELAVDRLDLVYLRVGGAMGPLPSESIGPRFQALAALQDEGMIEHLGLSNITRTQLARARSIAPVAAVQNNFHHGSRDGADVLADCEKAAIAFVPFFPLGGGIQESRDQRLEAVAQRHGATAAQIALAWTLTTSDVTLAIPGTGSLDHLAENMAARTVTLSDRDLTDLA